MGPYDGHVCILLTSLYWPNSTYYVSDNMHIVRAAWPLATKLAISVHFSHLRAVMHHLLSWTLPPTHSFSLMSPSHLASMLSPSFPPSHNLSFLALLYSCSFRHCQMPLVAQAILILERQHSKIVQLFPTATLTASSLRS